MSRETIVKTFWDNVESQNDKTAILSKKFGQYQPISWMQLGNYVLKLAGFLLDHQIKQSECIAILANSRFEWTVTDLSILSINGVCVPIYPTHTSSEIAFLLNHSQTQAIIVENKWQLEKLLALSDLLLKFVIVLDSKDVDLQANYPYPVFSYENIIMVEANHTIVQLQEYWPNREDLASIIYTSGTTGNPKGVMISHKNIDSICKMIMSVANIQPTDLILSFLPLSHVYERVGGQFLAICAKVPLAYAESMDQVAKNLLEVKPTYINAVPRFYEKVYQHINSEIRKMPQAQRYLVRWAIAIGTRAYNQAKSYKNESKLINNIYKTELRIADRLVYSKIRQRLGGRLRMMTSGAAPLASEIQTFFQVLGLPIMEGYGLTETCAPISCNFPGIFKIGTVGKPLPGIEINFSSDGELIVKGDSVFQGYYKDPESTQAVFKDGWFLTGDLATQDSDGYLKIIDRKKDIIITSGGKHIAPQFISNLYKNEKIINQVIAYGDFKKYLTALITLNHDELSKLAIDLGIKQTDIKELCNHPLVFDTIDKIIQNKNRELASFERIKKFIILTDELTIESGDLTPTLKVKRKKVIEKYHYLLDALYTKDETTIEEKTG